MIGLALSGGGFRAAFFELGAMAWLAEQRRLRDVTTISAVSGGSILAALYYMHVKRLAEEHVDGEINDEHYVEIIERVRRALIAAVQTNLRLRTFARLRSNIRMFWTTYSRTDRLGDLLEAEIYGQAANPAGREVRGMVRMSDLQISPKDGVVDNDARRAKLPELILNATVLQTGRRWEFTPIGMGEPSSDLDSAVGAPTPLVPFRRFEHFADADMPHGFAPPSDFEVGYAVAASAAVPGIFHPMTVSGVTASDQPTPLLVDGGVVDNQGVDALLTRGVGQIFAIDAGGQLTLDPNVRAGPLSSLLRSSDVQYGRVRYAQLSRMYERNAADNRIAHILRVGVGEPAARPLQHVRTDLDAFSDVEVAYLMRHGYCVAREVLPACDDPIDGRFAFNEPSLMPPSARMIKRLEVGRRQLGKVFSQSALAWIATAAFAVAFLAAVYAIVRVVTSIWPGARPYLPRGMTDFIAAVPSFFTRGAPVWVTLVGSLAVIIGSVVYLRMRWMRRLVGGLPLLRQIPWDWLIGIGRMAAAVLSWVFVVFAVRVLNPLFLRAGRLDREGSSR